MRRIENSIRVLALAVLAFAGPAPGMAAGTLHGPLRLSSAALGYDLQYWIYLPEGGGRGTPELYFTDGQDFLAAGDIVALLDREIATARIAPLSAVFVDSRDPDEPGRNRRNEQFMCNADYGRFFLQELMPAVSASWTGADADTRRGLAGVSFGAINAACFGQMMPGVFDLLILHSPGSEAHIGVVRELYESRPREPAAFFISHGGRQDNARATKRFARTLEHQGYPLRRLATDGRHDWSAWRPLLAEGLRAFAGTAAGDRVDGQ
jgi:enterochelin esterase-like enzyme